MYHYKEGARVVVRPYSRSNSPRPDVVVTYLHPYAYSDPILPEFVGRDTDGRKTVYRYEDILNTRPDDVPDTHEAEEALPTIKRHKSAPLALFVADLIKVLEPHYDVIEGDWLNDLALALLESVGSCLRFKSITFAELFALVDARTPLARK